MKKTKIICTMGPSSDDKEVLRKLIRNGMDIARFNFSHGTYEEQKERMDRLKEVRAEEKKHVAILLDTKGPEIRTGLLKDGMKVQLQTGQKFVLTTEEIVGDETKTYITYAGLVDDVSVGKKILIDDGLIELEVEDKTETDIICKVLNGGELGQRKGVNVPNVPVRLPALTDKDKEDILFGVEQGIDFIAASFVRNAECVLEIKALLRSVKAPYIPIIAKVENEEAMNNIDEIIRCADGIMIARGDLGVEIPAEKVPHIQKKLIKKCNDNFKPVITATQMLDSMIRNPRPTRAEVADVANAVYDGTDAVMLSGETAAGKYPVEALTMMASVVEDAEKHLDYRTIVEVNRENRCKGVPNAIGYAAMATADAIGAKCIITPTFSGATARVVSKFKPRTPIYGVSPNEEALRRMQIYWGVTPMKSIEVNTTDDICNGAIDLVKAKQIVDTGDTIVLTAGIPSSYGRSTPGDGISNMMHVAVVE